MQKVVLVRFSEIHLKGKNRSFFENKLVSNIKKTGAGKAEKSRGRIMVTLDNGIDFDAAKDKLKKVFGIHSFSPVHSCKNDTEEIKALAKELTAGLAGTFRVSANRADKTFPLPSMQLAGLVGEYVLRHNPSLKVNLQKFETELCIDVRPDGVTHLFLENISGPGGMPVGTGGKGLVLLSGGIDSPVAAYSMAKRGMDCSALHFHSFPYTSLRAKEKVKTLAEKLKAYIPSLKLYTISTTKIQEEINRLCPSNYHIVLLRRFMMRLASQLAKKISAQAIITGEALGQVASQTIESITATNAAAALPVLRPLIAFDKEEIVRLAQKIGTYETSILPYEDCCTVFLPSAPITRPKLENVERVEKLLPVEELTAAAFDTLEILD